MFTLHQLSEADLIHYLLAQRQQRLTYEPSGDSLRSPAPGYTLQRLRVPLGHGRTKFELGRQAVRDWKVFPREMATLFWPDRPVETGTIFAVQFRFGPLRSLNPCRIVSKVDQSAGSDSPARFGFSYGTLPDHLECGEARFLVEWFPHDDTVWFELLGISRPNPWLARVAWPLVQRAQGRFRELSGQSMRRAVQEPVWDSLGAAP